MLQGRQVIFPHSRQMERPYDHLGLQDLCLRSLKSRTRPHTAHHMQILRRNRESGDPREWLGPETLSRPTFLGLEIMLERIERTSRTLTSIVPHGSKHRTPEAVIFVNEHQNDRWIDIVLALEGRL